MMLHQKKCLACEGETAPLDDREVKGHLKSLEDWDHDPKKHYIFKTFRFKDQETLMSFINAVSWISHQENHHPLISFSFRECTISYQTHSLKALSENDFICAAKVDYLLK